MIAKTLDRFRSEVCRRRSRTHARSQESSLAAGSWRTLARSRRHRRTAVSMSNAAKAWVSRLQSSSCWPRYAG